MKFFDKLAEWFSKAEMPSDSTMTTDAESNF